MSVFEISAPVGRPVNLTGPAEGPDRADPPLRGMHHCAGNARSIVDEIESRLMLASDDGGGSLSKAAIRSTLDAFRSHLASARPFRETWEHCQSAQEQDRTAIAATGNLASFLTYAQVRDAMRLAFVHQLSWRGRVWQVAFVRALLVTLKERCNLDVEERVDAIYAGLALLLGRELRIDDIRRDRQSQALMSEMCRTLRGLEDQYARLHAFTDALNVRMTLDLPRSDARPMPVEQAEFRTFLNALPPVSGRPVI